MVDRFSVFRGYFDPGAMTSSFLRGYLDPGERRRNAAATSVAEGQAAFQPIAQRLKVGKFGLDTQNTLNDTNRLGLDTQKFGYQMSNDDRQLEDKQAARVAEAKNIRDRSLGSYSPWALAATDSGQSPEQALALGSKKRVEQAGRESGARTGAAESVKRKFLISKGAMQKADELVMAAQESGTKLPWQEAIKQAQEMIGETIYTPKGRNQLTDAQRQQAASYKLVERTITAAMNNQMDPTAELTRLLGSQEEAQRMMDLYRRGLQGGGQAGGQPAAQPVDTDVSDLLELAIGEYGEDPSKWPPEVLNDPNIKAAIEASKR